MKINENNKIENFEKTSLKSKILIVTGPSGVGKVYNKINLTNFIEMYGIHF